MLHFGKTTKLIVAAVAALLLVSVALVSVAATASVAAVGNLLVWHYRTLNLPAPTGPYAVGRAGYDWTDPGRIDLLSDRAGEQRELAVWIWYPASPAADESYAPYLPLAWQAAWNQEQGIGRFIQSDPASVNTYSIADAPVAQNGAGYPVIIMQPGMGPAAPDYTVYAENLASHGYVVVGINPAYSSNLIVFPDGRVVRRTDEGVIPENAGADDIDKDAARIGKVWSDDDIFVMDQLQRLNENAASRFHNTLDLGHIGLFGHSFGGATAARVCKTDPRCKAGADLDGTLFSYQAEDTLTVPFMFMASEDCGSDCETMREVFAASDSDAYFLMLRGARHFNFSDLPLRLSPLARLLFRVPGIIGSIRPQRGLTITNTYLLAFFDEYLKGDDTGLLNGTSPAFPEVEFASHPAR